jgi:hypothetical protein
MRMAGGVITYFWRGKHACLCTYFMLSYLQHNWTMQSLMERRGYGGHNSYLEYIMYKLMYICTMYIVQYRWVTWSGTGNGGQNYGLPIIFVWGRRKIIRRRESLVLNKSFNTLWVKHSVLYQPLRRKSSLPIDGMPNRDPNPGSIVPYDRQPRQPFSYATLQMPPHVCLFVSHWGSYGELIYYRRRVFLTTTHLPPSNLLGMNYLLPRDHLWEMLNLFHSYSEIIYCIAGAGVSNLPPPQRLFWDFPSVWKVKSLPVYGVSQVCKYLPVKNID